MGETVKRPWKGRAACRLFGHRPSRVDTERFRAVCARCGVGLVVGYDPAYGETVVIKEAKREGL